MVRKYLTSIYYETTLGKKLIHPFIVIRNRILGPNLLLKIRFKRMLGYSLNLNSPSTFNEKIQWLKINDKTPLHVLCADKFAVREHITKVIGENYLIPLILSTKDVQNISTETFPEYPVIIKTNHDSGGITIIRDKSKVKWADLRKKLQKQLDSNYDNGKGEWQYKDIVPRLVVEKLIMDIKGNIPFDYKFFCFNGKVQIIQVDIDREVDHKRNLYSPEWELLSYLLKYKNGPAIRKPEVINTMIRLAETLAIPFIFVRVDLYVVENKIYFGELTFHPESGFGKFIPDLWDKKIGDLLTLPSKKFIETNRPRGKS